MFKKEQKQKKTLAIKSGLTLLSPTVTRTMKRLGERRKTVQTPLGTTEKNFQMFATMSGRRRTQTGMSTAVATE